MEEQKKKKEIVPKREVQCSEGHNKVKFSSKFKIPTCPVCHKEVKL